MRVLATSDGFALLFRDRGEARRIGKILCNMKRGHKILAVTSDSLSREMLDVRADEARKVADLVPKEVRPRKKR